MELQHDMICENLSVGKNGHLLFAGQDTVSLAKQYGTPLYLLDEDRIRARCRLYRESLRAAFPAGAKALYASKAASFKRIYEIMKDEGMGIDVVSAGEIATAVRAGFPMENAYFHSNNKTDEDIALAMDHGIGYFVSDNAEELRAIEAEAAKRGTFQKVLLRLTPGIDPHTYEAVATGRVDSKFGFAIPTGQAEEAVRLALSLPHLVLEGFHCHVGSQVFDSDVYLRTADVMLEFVEKMFRTCRYQTKVLDLGGGYGVRYTEDQPCIDIAANIALVGEKVNQKIASLGIPTPVICMEPGRSIVADAGMTLYTVGTVKTVRGYETYVSVDGGMTDNIRHALYGASYTILPADHMKESRTLTADLVGRCCESGDVLQTNVAFPSSVQRGDLVACLTTGAYHYSMASNYNRIPRPPVVMLSGGSSYVAVRRETADDIVRLDV